MAYIRPTTEAEKAQADRVREEKLVALQQRLKEQVQSITTGEQWAAWLRTAGRFHSYSWGNTILIAMQMPQATKVAGYKTWAQVGRHVRKGETGITILAPVVRRSEPTAPEASEPTKSTVVRPEQSSPEPNNDRPVRRVLGFRPVHVFDLSQTDGQPLAEPPRPQLTRGQAPEGLWEALAAQVKAAGFDLSTSAMQGPDGPDGVTNFLSRTVTVRDGVEQAHMCVTLGHELAHVLLHDPSSFIDGQTIGCRGDAEVEAESVAYLIGSIHGINVDDFTFPYVAGWVGRQDPGTVIEASGKRVLATAHDILGQVEAAMDTSAGDRDSTSRPRLLMTGASIDAGTAHDNPSSQLPVAPSESLAAQARWEGPVRAAGGEDLVGEPIWPQVAVALERAAIAGFDVSDDLPNLVDGQWVTSLRLMDDPGLNLKGSATESASPTVLQALSHGVRAQTFATTTSKAQSTSARSR